MTSELVEQLNDHVLTLTINRPERRNALNAEVIAGIQQGLQRSQSDPQVRLLVLTGSGADAFCSGADLQGSAFEFDYSRPSSGYANLLRTARATSTPLIARVNGACMAGGMGLLAMCDLVVAAKHAIFGLPEVKVGVFPMQVLSVLQGTIPERWLSRLCLTGESIAADVARDIGLVNEVAEDIDAATAALVRRILGNSPAAIRRGLYAMKRTRTLPFEQSMAFTESQIGLVALTQDAKEGLTSFKEKRKPVWVGR